MCVFVCVSIIGTTVSSIIKMEFLRSLFALYYNMITNAFITKLVNKLYIPYVSNINQEKNPAAPMEFGDIT